MRKNLIFAGAKVYNKVNRKYYLVVSEDGTAVRLERDENGKDIQIPEETVQITESNGLAYRFIKDTRPAENPTGYTVDNGVLLKNGNPVSEQGQLTVNRILAAFPDQLLLITELNGNTALTRYFPKRDKYQKAKDFVGNPHVIHDVADTDQVLLVRPAKNKARFTEGNGSVAKDISEGTSLMYVNATGIKEQGTEYYIDQVLCVWPYTCFCLATQDIEPEEDIDGEMQPVLVDTDPFLVVIDQYGNTETIRGIGKEANIVYTPEFGGYTIVGKDRVVLYSVEDEIVKVIPTTDTSVFAGKTLIDITIDGATTRYAFANTEATEIKTLVVKTTADRGDIVTVE